MTRLSRARPPPRPPHRNKGRIAAIDETPGRR